MFTTFDSDQQFDPDQSSIKEFTLDTTIEELESGIRRPDTVVNSRIWQNIPILMRDSSLLEERNLQKTGRLMNAILQILNECVKNEISIVNRRLLHSSLSTLASSPNLSKAIRVGAGQCLLSLDSLEDGHFVLVETVELKSMEEATLHNTQTISKQKEEIDQLSHTITTLERQNKEEEERLTKEKKDVVAEMEAMLTKEREKLNEAEEKVEKGKEREQASEIARREAEQSRKKMEEEKKKAETERAKMEEEKKKAETERAKMEEEKKKAETERAKMEEEKKKAETERAKMEEEKKKAETERAKMEEEKKKAEEGKRTAEERQRQAEEQKGQVQRDKEKLADEVKRTREELRKARDEKETSEREKREMAEKMERMRKMLRTEWTGTESLQTLDRTAHKLTPTKLTQINKVPGGSSTWRTAFTGPIEDGEWELQIRASANTFENVLLGFLRHPLPENATHYQCGFYGSGIGGDFILCDGRLWKEGNKFKPEGTNKICDRIGQTAAIRVNMRTRDARLFVDNEEQPGIFTDIPSPLCLGITTGFGVENGSVEVLWLKRLRS
ncbi:hypothetical protein BLNAU_17234 [Blattamonas nauphoetae]|uniref:Uncharacterized protein n=1 Tax=Blattamonas nauphoetae TaxID=2049346 RepID=A0ABQ9XAB4_9EUKA|nr:hypothetical protein BLNAU_17234 [Blattamonas nauphoetae]